MDDRVVDRAAAHATPAELAVRDWLLAGLSFSAGMYEAICFLAFGKVFAGFQTGNLVLLGFGSRAPARPLARTRSRSSSPSPRSPPVPRWRYRSSRPSTAIRRQKITTSSSVAAPGVDRARHRAHPAGRLLRCVDHGRFARQSGLHSDRLERVRDGAAGERHPRHSTCRAFPPRPLPPPSSTCSAASPPGRSPRPVGAAPDRDHGQHGRRWLPRRLDARPRARVRTGRASGRNGRRHRDRLGGPEAARHRRPGR